MKLPLFFILAWLALRPACGQAPASMAAEFAKLQEQQHKAEQAAMEPLKRRYVEALQTLLRRANAFKDTDTALRIREEIQRVGPDGATAAVPTMEAKTAEGHLTRSRWSFPVVTTEPADKQFIEFLRKGELYAGWDPSRALRKWTVNPDGAVQLYPYGQPTRMVTLRIDPTGRTGTLVDEGGNQFKTERQR